MHYRDNYDDDDDDEDNKEDDDEDNKEDDDKDADGTVANLDWVSDVLPGGDEGHADEEDDEGSSIVQLEPKVVNRSRIGLPGRKIKVNLRTFGTKVKVDLMISWKKVKVNVQK